jgi:hypothetical protein
MTSSEENTSVTFELQMRRKYAFGGYTKWTTVYCGTLQECAEEEGIYTESCGTPKNCLQILKVTREVWVR